jgi:hypothetical protein
MFKPTRMNTRSRKKLRILLLAVLAAGVITYIALDEEHGAWLRRVAKSLLRELIRAF